ncbi:hypothetical protein EAS64_01900 [Trebonia kvetii]|uniref:Uncharacterized protein n=1 Tax=Trebonia kvetii TaxID=2480626 RepID=A0A6P2C477_9ACTN|nr:hypothetical protein EAS64_01900 [Trebonia kvetii]
MASAGRCQGRSADPGSCVAWRAPRDGEPGLGGAPRSGRGRGRGGPGGWSAGRGRSRPPA